MMITIYEHRYRFLLSFPVSHKLVYSNNTIVGSFEVSIHLTEMLIMSCNCFIWLDGYPVCWNSSIQSKDKFCGTTSYGDYTRDNSKNSTVCPIQSCPTNNYFDQCWNPEERYKKRYLVTEVVVAVVRALLFSLILTVVIKKLNERYKAHIKKSFTNFCWR